MIISGGIFEKKDIKNKLQKLTSETTAKNFWKNQNKAKSILREKNFYEVLINSFNSLDIEIKNLEELHKLSFDEKDDLVIKDCLIKADNIFDELKKIEVNCYLSGENDKLDIYLEIHAGAGGTESQDWADMLKRMYLKWFDKKKFTYEIISEHKGEEAGIKSATLKILGVNLYGLMKSESGVHRLVRISPFDSGARRHTSFASVWVYPVVDDNIDIKIDETDLRIDTYRSSGAGGQHVNTTDSAVRITHLPSKIVVQCQNERSQHKNKETCFKMLKARLYEFELQKREKINEKKLESKTEIGWGHQIRSYVLQPYQLVKDLRNKTESTNPQEVLNGELDKFIEAGILNR